MAAKITLHGIEYTPAADVARALGFSRERIAQICRSGQVDTKQMGTTWFVSEPSLTAFLAAQEERELKRPH